MRTTLLLLLTQIVKINMVFVLQIVCPISILYHISFQLHLQEKRSYRTPSKCLTFNNVYSKIFVSEGDGACTVVRSPFFILISL